MSKKRDLLTQLQTRSSNRGATTVEYAVITAILILAIAAAVILLEGQTSEIFNSVGDQVGGFSNLPSS